MLLSILGGLVTAVYVCVGWYHDQGPLHDWIDYVILGLVGVIVLVVSGALILFALSLVGLCFKKQWVRESATQLIRLRGVEGVSGSFFLGCGNVGSTEYYMYYTPLPDSGYRPGHIANDDNVTIYEEGRNDGVMITYHREFINPLLDLLLFQGWPCRYEFHIPKGSLKLGYTL